MRARTTIPGIPAVTVPPLPLGALTAPPAGGGRPGPAGRGLPGARTDHRSRNRPGPSPALPPRRHFRPGGNR
ncbi:hypothetical protein GCM10009602_60350 [Nocardiopsis tropica]